MPNSQSVLEYRSKKEEITKRFHKEFLEGNNSDPMFRTIVEMLIRDTDPYELIERLIVDRQELVSKMRKLIDALPARTKIEW